MRFILKRTRIFVFENFRKSSRTLVSSRWVSITSPQYRYTDSIDRHKLKAPPVVWNFNLFRSFGIRAVIRGQPRLVLAPVVQIQEKMINDRTGLQLMANCCCCLYWCWLRLLPLLRWPMLGVMFYTRVVVLWMQCKTRCSGTSIYEVARGFVNWIGVFLEEIPF